MIGVLVSDHEKALAAEFFELFKTPWEFWQAGRGYRVLITSLDNAAPRGRDLTINFRAYPQALDAKGKNIGYCFISYGEMELPVYGTLSKIDDAGAPIIHTKNDGRVVGTRERIADGTVIRLGFNLFHETEYLLTTGQPRENSPIPSLEYHIAILRDLIVTAGIPLVEIPPVPAGYRYAACLTHDIDFLRLRDHFFDHTMFGFIYRATVGSLLRYLNKSISFKKMVRNWQAVLELPLVILGLRKDYWEQIPEYMKLESKYKSTFFMIPFKNRPGEISSSPDHERRAAKYDIAQATDLLKQMVDQGFEVALHGINAWHDRESASEERGKITSCANESEIGVRMHWLYFNEDTFGTLDDAGFLYDSTYGYNDAIGYKGGTTQVFRPLKSKDLLELQLNIQDTAMFYPDRLDLSEKEASARCEELMNCNRTYGGALTLLWHDRSLAPERLWGDFYKGLLEKLENDSAWIAPAGRGVQWFRKRRGATFEGINLESGAVEVRVNAPEAVPGDEHLPGLLLRVHYLREDRDPSGKPQSRKMCIDVPLKLNSSTRIELS